MEKATYQISIVLPCYNAEKNIRQTIDSILQQSFNDYELIVVDDQSTDATLACLEPYKNLANLKLLVLEKNSGGPARPRNVGVAEAIGEYIAFIDADDIWHPRKLEYQLKTLADQKAEFCSSAMKNFTEIVPDFSDTDHIDSLFLGFGGLLKKNKIPTSSVLLKRSIIDGLNFNELANYKAVEDYQFWLQVHERIDQSVKITSPVLLAYRDHESGISNSKLDQAKKIWMLLKNYEMSNGKSFGLVRRFYYYMHYVIQSVFYRVIKKSL